MTRSELFRLIWDRPMTHVATSLGVSSAVLRKMCLQHDIPMPSAGYWTKIAHGKTEGRPSLPEASPSLFSRVNVAIRRLGHIPVQIADAQIGDYDIRFEDEANAALPDAADVPHPTLLALQQALADRVPDEEGFVAVEDPALPRVRVGGGSIQRVLLLVDALFNILQKNGWAIRQADDGLQCFVNDERFAIKIYEARHRSLHVPEISDLRSGAGDVSHEPPSASGDSDRVGWQYGPSGKLAVAVFDTRPFRWSAKNVVGYWYDRDGRPVEKCLGDVVTRVASVSKQIKRARARSAGQQTQFSARLQRLRDEAVSAEARLKQRKFLVGKARSYSEYLDLLRFQSYVMSLPASADDDALSRMKQDLSVLVSELAESFAPGALNAEIADLGMFSKYERD